MNNYANNVFEAIDTIINQRLSELSFDRTITCKIVEEVKDKPNTYWVSNDSMRFQAISQDGKKYGKKEEVFVLIPNGEYSNEKIITGSRIDNSKDGYNKMKYISTKEQFVEYNTIQLFTDELSINATRDNQKSSISKTIDITEYKYNIPIEYIGLSFQLDTLDLFKTNEKSGQYAISIGFWNNDEKLHGTINDVSEYTIASKELYGNPYAFSSSFEHFMLLPFKINDITQINKITIDLSQNGEFNYTDNSAIEIKLSSVSLSFGFEKGSSNIDKSKLILEKNQTLDYKSSDITLSRNLYLQHVQGNQVYNYINTNLPDGYFIDWFKYTLNHKDNSYFKVNGESEDEWKVQNINLNLWNWKKLTNSNKFIYSLTLDKDAPKEQYKAIVWKRNETTLDITNESTGETSQKTVYSYDFTEVEGITFNNTAVSEASGAVGEGNGLRLELDQGNTGVYNIYASTGKALNSSATSKIYNIRAVFVENLSMQDVEDNGILWKFPDGNTMIQQYKVENEGEEPAAASLEAQYKINSDYLPGAMNNRIWCYIKLKDGRELSASLTLQFGYGSTSGSNYAFNIDFLNNRTCLYSTEENDHIEVEAVLQDQTGRAIQPPAITWSWEYIYKETSGDQTAEHPEISISGIKFEKQTNTKVKLTIDKDIDVFTDGNFSFLKATIQDYGLDENKQKADLTAYLPIPICNNTNVQYISGATYCVYGISSTEIEYSKEKYYLQNSQGDYQLNNNKTQNSDLIYKPNTRLAWSTPTLKQQNKYKEDGTVDYEEYSLMLPSYAPAYNGEMQLPQLSVIVASAWAQPILIIQNRWGMQLLNDWDGKFKIDEKEGYLLSNLLVAGYKDTNNSFTGVVTGDIKTTEITENGFFGRHTGIYGFKEGKNRFRLTDDGEFYVGTDNGSRIYFDDNGELQIIGQTVDINAEEFTLNAGELKLIGTERFGQFYVGNSTDYISYNYEVDTYGNGLQIKSSTFDLYSDNLWINENGIRVFEDNFGIYGYKPGQQGEALDDTQALLLTDNTYKTVVIKKLTNSISLASPYISVGQTLIGDGYDNTYLGLCLFDPRDNDNFSINNTYTPNRPAAQLYWSSTETAAILSGYKNLSLAVSNETNNFLGLTLTIEQDNVVGKFKCDWNTQSNLYFEQNGVVQGYISSYASPSGAGIAGFSLVSGASGSSSSTSWLIGGWRATHLTITNKLLLESNVDFKIECAIKGNSSGYILFDDVLASTGENYLDLYGCPSIGDDSSNNRTKTGIRIYCGSGNNAFSKKYREISISSTGLLYIDNS